MRLFPCRRVAEPATLRRCMCGDRSPADGPVLERGATTNAPSLDIRCRPAGSSETYRLADVGRPLAGRWGRSEERCNNERSIARRAVSSETTRSGRQRGRCSSRPIGTTEPSRGFPTLNFIHICAHKCGLRFGVCRMRKGRNRNGGYLRSSMIADRGVYHSKLPLFAALSEFILILGKLGGHLGRKRDGPPGPQSIWQGLARVRDFALVWSARQEL